METETYNKIFEVKNFGPEKPKEFGFVKEWIEKATKNPESLGIISEFSDRKTGAAIRMICYPEKNLKDIAKEAGINNVKLRVWRTEDDFNKVVESACGSFAEYLFRRVEKQKFSADPFSVFLLPHVLAFFNADVFINFWKIATDRANSDYDVFRLWNILDRVMVWLQSRGEVSQRLVDKGFLKFDVELILSRKRLRKERKRFFRFFGPLFNDFLNDRWPAK